MKKTCKRELTFVFILKGSKPLLQMGPHNKCILLKLFFLNYSQNSQSCGCAYRVSTKGVEVTSASKNLRNLRCGDHCTKGNAISNAL